MVIGEYWDNEKANNTSFQDGFWLSGDLAKIDEEGLVRETSELFGFAAVREHVANSMKRGIDYALKNNMITLDDMKYKIVN